MNDSEKEKKGESRGGYFFRRIVFLSPSNGGIMKTKITQIIWITVLVVIGLCNYYSNADYTIWGGPKKVFTKADYADWTLPENQDRITDNIWLTRQNSRGLFNIKVESEYDLSEGPCNSASPRDTKWGFGTTSNMASITFENWVFWNDCNPPYMVNEDAVLFLVKDRVFLDIKFISWTSGGEGGGFSYERTDPKVFLTIHGDRTIYVKTGIPFTDPGATAVNINNDPVSVVVTGAVDINTPGAYILTYTANDTVTGYSAVGQRKVVVSDNAPVIWNGPKISFTKPDWADWTQEQNQDRITENVWLTRKNTEGLFNIKIESSYGSFSPLDTEWAYGTLDEVGFLDFQPWVNWHNGCPPCSIGKDAVLHLISDNIFIQIKFLSWTSGGQGGGFSYERTAGTNNPPTLTSVAVLYSALEDVPFNITYVALASAADESDPDEDQLSFRIVSVLSGTLAKNGEAVTPGSTLLSPGESLVWTAPSNLSGLFTAFTVVAWDGKAASATPVQVKINVLPVNDPPSFDVKSNSIVVNEDSPQSNISGFAYNINKGADNERSQPIMFKVVVDKPELFSVPPTIKLNGTLSFKPAPNAHGRAIVTAYLIDGGGTANGGSDTSAPRDFTIDIINVNDPPVLKPLDRYFINRTEYEDTYEGGGYKYSFGVTDLETPAGNLSLTVTSTNQNLVPNGNIQISANGTNRIVTVKPVANAFGTTLLTFTLSDGTNSVTKTSLLRVLPVNDKPYFELLTDTVRCLSASGRYMAEIINMSTVSVGPQNESSQSWTFQVVSNTDPAAFVSPPVVNKYGILSFTPKKGFIGNVTIGIRMVDSGGVANGGDNTYGPLELTIQFFDYPMVR